MMKRKWKKIVSIVFFTLVFPFYILSSIANNNEVKTRTSAFDPKTYSIPGWPEERSRNASLYINYHEDDSIIKPRKVFFSAYI